MADHIPDHDRVLRGVRPNQLEWDPERNSVRPRYNAFRLRADDEGELSCNWEQRTDFPACFERLRMSDALAALVAIDVRSAGQELDLHLDAVHRPTAHDDSHSAILGLPDPHPHAEGGPEWALLDAAATKAGGTLARRCQDCVIRPGADVAETVRKKYERKQAAQARS